jgi:hypothetical protein
VIDGKMVISNAVIDGSIQIVDVVLKSDLIAGMKRRPESDEMVMTEAASMDLEMLDCDGDVLLPGLILAGALSARNMKVRGYLELIRQTMGRRASTIGQRKGQTYSAVVKGSIDFGGSELGWLQCISICGNGTGDEREWCLEQATVKRLVFFEPYPMKINMRGAEFHAMDFPEDEGNRRVREEVRWLCEPRLEFVSMEERLLRKEGEPEKANDAYAHHQRMVHPKIGWLTGGFFRVMSWKGMTIGCLAGLIVLWGVAWLMTYPAANWKEKIQKEPVSLAGLIVPTEVHERRSAYGFWAAANIAVPIVHLAEYEGDDKPALKNSGKTTFAGVELPVSPASVASLISMAGTLVGAFFLVSVSGLAKRE